MRLLIRQPLIDGSNTGRPSVGPRGGVRDPLPAGIAVQENRARQSQIDATQACFRNSRLAGRCCCAPASRPDAKFQDWEPTHVSNPNARATKEATFEPGISDEAWPGDSRAANPAFFPAR